jgi:hypothetical protein
MFGDGNGKKFQMSEGHGIVVQVTPCGSWAQLLLAEAEEWQLDRADRDLT